MWLNAMQCYQIIVTFCVSAHTHLQLNPASVNQASSVAPMSTIANMGHALVDQPSVIISLQSESSASYHLKTGIRKT